jgi:hypothetical protein
MNQDKLRGEMVSSIIAMIQTSGLEDEECNKCIFDCLAMWLFVTCWPGNNADLITTIIVNRYKTFKKTASEMGLTLEQWMALLR